MPRVPVTILGGLPVIAEVWFSGPDYQGEYDAGCDALYWRKRDGTAGSEVSERIYDRLGDWWQADVTEQANDWLGEHTPMKDDPNPVWSEEFCRLNPDPPPGSRRARQIGLPVSSSSTACA